MSLDDRKMTLNSEKEKREICIRNATFETAVKSCSYTGAVAERRFKKP